MAVGIVWIDMLRTDRREKAERAAQMIRDPRVQHFHDPERRAGRAVAQSLGADGPIAWDMYLFYPQDAAWEADPPTPTQWIHQLWGRRWADPSRYRRGKALREALAEIAAGQLGGTLDDAGP
ncbi:MAG: hypothetical protein ACE5NC_01520 [Anaerolineae bacterium]